MRHRIVGALVTVLVGMASSAAWAQNGVVPALEVVVGHAGYVDEVWDHRMLVGGGVRWSIARATVGPELVFQHGREGSGEVVATLAGTYALVPAPRSRRAWPFAVVAAGMSRRSEIVGRGPNTPGLATFVSHAFTASVGLGVNVRLGPITYATVDARLGWEPESRVTFAVGWRP